MKLGSHVGMSGKEMLLGSAKEAVSYGAKHIYVLYRSSAEHKAQRNQRTEYFTCLGIYERTWH